MKIVYLDWRANRRSRRGIEFDDFNLLTMVVSALKARLFGHITKFYGDRYAVRKLEKLHLESAWDEIDDTNLDRVIDQKSYDTDYFFNVGKFFVLQLEQAPVMLMDTDLIPWEDPFVQIHGGELQAEAAFTHWESVLPRSDWYCRKGDYHIPKGYRWNRKWDFRLKAANTSIIYFRQDEQKDYFCREALRFMKENDIPTGRSWPDALFAEQRLLLMCMKEKGLLGLTVPIIDTVWSAKYGKFTKKDESLGWWDFFIPEQRERITHTWIAKKDIKRNRKYRDYFCCRLLEEITMLSPGVLGELERNTGYDRYFRLLNQWGSVDVLLKRGLVSSCLYERE